MVIDSCSYAPFGAIVRSSYNVSSICDFLEEIARQKLFRLISSGNRSPKTFSAHFLRKSPATKLFSSFPQEIARQKTFSAHFLRKSPATKLFRLISSGNRLPQNFFGSFPQEIARHKTFSAHFLRKSAATNFFSSFPQEIAGMAYIELDVITTSGYRAEGA